jgi:DNA replication protein DnaC
MTNANTATVLDIDEGQERRLNVLETYCYSGGTIDQREELRRRLKNVALLGLDDLGKSRLTEAAEDALFDLVDHRYAHGKPVLVTTQHTGDKLATRFANVANGQAFARRLRDTSQIVTVTP